MWLAELSGDRRAARSVSGLVARWVFQRVEPLVLSSADGKVHHSAEKLVAQKAGGWVCCWADRRGALMAESSDVQKVVPMAGNLVGWLGNGMVEMTGLHSAAS